MALNKYKCVEQHDAADCGAAALATVCRHYGLEVSITKIRDIVGTDIKGTNIKGIVEGAEKLGLEAKAIRVDREAFMSKFTLPAIAHIITDEGLSHFVVVHKIKKKKVVVADPAKGIVKYDHDEFFNIFDGVIVLMIPTSSFEKGKQKTSSIFKMFINLLLPQKKLLVTTILASLALSIFGIVSSFFSKILIDEILPYNLKNSLYIYVFIFFMISIFQILISAFRQHILLFLSRKIDIPLLLGYYKHILSLPMNFFSTRKTGDILTRFQDAATIKEIFTGVSLSLVIDIGLATITGAVLYFLNSKLFGIIVIMLIISIILIYAFKLPYKILNKKEMEQSVMLNSQMIESLKNIETIKGYAIEEDQLERLEKRFIASLKTGYKEGILSNIQGSISGGVSTVGNLAIMTIGAISIMKGDMTIGDLLVFSTLSGYFIEPISNLIGLQLTFQEASIAMSRLSEIYELKREQDEEEERLKDIDLKGDIVLENIDFKYGARKNVLDNLNLSIPQGKKIALVGESGAGKTTIAKLLLNFYEPNEGRVLINDFDIKDIDLKYLRNKVGYVSQNIELFTGKIIDNIKVGNPDKKYQDIILASKKSGCHEFIERMPGRYESFLEEQGSNLSGGERQRISIARALLKEPDILILDEATSNLDFASEKIIHDMVFKHTKDITTLVIAHRLSTIQKCDLIYCISDGKVKEYGTHEELLKTKGYYYNMWMSQVDANFVRRDDDSEVNVNDTIDEKVKSTGEELTYA